MSKLTITFHDINTALLPQLVAVLGGDTAVSTPAPAPASAPASVPEVPAPAEAPAPAPTAQTYPDTVDEEVGLDARGLPWDNRINAGSKKKKQDGNWKLKPGTDKALVEQIEAELAQCAPSGPEIPAAPANEAAHKSATVTFKECVQLVTKALSNGEIEDDELDDIYQVHGIDDVSDLATKPESMAPFYADLKGYIDE